MRIILVLASLLVLAGCETMDFSSVTVSSGVSTYHPVSHSHIRYTLGYYTGTYYNGYRVYGDYGHRYYRAPRGYRHHRHYSRPVVVNRYHYTPPRRHDNRRHENREHRNEHKRKEHKRRDHRRDDRRDDRRERRRHN